MPKVGRYDYPFFDVDLCIEKLGKYYGVTKTDVTPREVVAETLNMKMRGGGFAYLMASMEKYGLIQTGGGNVTITKLGKTILYGEPTEIEQAKRQAIMNVDLFKDLHDQYGKDVQLEQIRAFLRQKANVDIEIAQKMAPSVAKIYKKVANYIIPAKKPAPSSEGANLKGSGFGRRETTTETEIGKEPLKIQKGGLYIEILSDAKVLENIEYAKDFLTFMEGKLKVKTEPKKDK